MLACAEAEPQQAKRRKTYEPEARNSGSQSVITAPHECARVVSKANSKRKRRRSSTSTDSSDS
eukprot:729479-Amphidinium_carterae.2